MFQINSHRRVFLNFLVLVVLIINCIQQSSSLSIHSSSRSKRSSSNRSTMPMSMMQQVQSKSQKKLITISEKVWRTAASNHRKRIQSILRPGLTSRDDQINTGSRRQGSRQYVDDWTALDPKNPIYNFLIEYYGIKGSKGPRRLGRWSPDPSLLLSDHAEEDASESADSHNLKDEDIGVDKDVHERIYKAAMEASQGHGGILLNNANEDDMGGTLHLRGSIPILSEDGNDFYGILYNPAIFYNRYEPILVQSKSQTHEQKILKAIAPFQWYSSILRSTLSSEPILHCFGLHEWAMQYHPPGAPPPPSAKYQSSLPLRVSREVINQTVERKGISCTHVDALRFFAPAAGPLNHHGAELERTDQLKLEQKGCVHAHMDLLKIALKLQPFVDGDLIGDVLEVAIKARRLDVEASPYDAREYGAGIVAVETLEGRKIYKERQRALMEESEPVRIRLLQAYEDFMELAFEEEYRRSDLQERDKHKTQPLPFVAPERLAKAQPGGLPWRHNLIES